MSLLPDPEPIVAERAGLKCFLRPGTTDELVWDETVVAPRIEQGLRLPLGEKWLDLGGYIGTFALWIILAKKGQVVSVEALPETANWYRKNFELNGLEPQLLEFAVMSEPPSKFVDLLLPVPSPRPLHTPSGFRSKPGVLNLSAATLYTRWKRPHPSVSVPTLSFKKAVARAKKILGAKGPWNLKIDIEGAEAEIFENDDLSMFDRIFFGYHYQAGGGTERMAKIIKRFEEMGFQLKLKPPFRDGPLWWNQTYHFGWASK